MLLVVIAGDRGLPFSSGRRSWRRWDRDRYRSRAFTDPAGGSGVVTRADGTTMPKVLVIAGPTAVGKTSLSLRMAAVLGGEILSADSVQVYKGLDVGSSKLPASEREGIRHHLIDLLHPAEEFGAGDFCEHAITAIDDIVRRGKVPIVVGGTGLYLRWLIGGKPPTPPSNPATAAAAKAAVEAAAEAERRQAAARLKSVVGSDAGAGDSGDTACSGNTGWRGAVRLLAESGDPETAGRLAENDWYRMERAMEIVMSTGRPVGDFKPAPPPSYDFRCVMLTSPRIPLYRRIDERVELMVRDGMLEEAAGMLAQGIPPGGSPAARSIGYRQAIEFLVELAERRGSAAEASCTPQDLLHFVEETQKATRAFAKRQFTWFRGEKDGLYTWIDVSAGTQSELDDAVLTVFQNSIEEDIGEGASVAAGDAAHDPGNGGDTAGTVGRASAVIDGARGEVDKDTAQALKRYRAEQTLLDSSAVSEDICRRVDRLVAQLAGSVPRVENP